MDIADSCAAQQSLEAAHGSDADTNLAALAAQHPDVTPCIASSIAQLTQTKYSTLAQPMG